MGYSFESLSKIMDQKCIFKGKKILTLGTLYPYVNKKESHILNERGLDTSVDKNLFSKYLFVEVLGADLLHSLDVSDYQGSEIICNLNRPVPEQYIGEYDLVFDGGTLEHLSNLQVALSNIFSLLRADGYYYFGVPCNNWVDHGFFQFSPTFFKDLCADNKSLKLLEMHLNTQKKYYDFRSINSAFLKAICNSSERLSVGGIIQKIGSDFDFDLTQAKYRVLHSQDAGKEISLLKKQTFSRYIVLKFVNWVSITQWLPLSAKELVLNFLYKLKR